MVKTLPVEFINYITVVEERLGNVAYIAGTPLEVAEIAYMHIHNDSPVEWILENFDGLGLTHANIYAALSYYYDHRAEIDDYVARVTEAARAQADADLSDVIARMKARLKSE